MSHLGFMDTYGTSSKAVDALFTRQKNNTMVCELNDDDGKFLVARIDHEESPLLPAVVGVIARGECGSTSTAPDPMLDWVYCARKDSVCEPLPEPPSKHRVEWFKWLSHYLCLFGAHRNALYALIAKDSGRVVAAAICGPPYSSAFDRSYDEMGRNLRKAGTMELAQEILAGNIRMNSLGAWQHKHGCGGTDGYGNFLYISTFATAPEFQGQGCGSTLLRFIGKVADADGVATYLETAGVRNTAFYSKKGGFEVVVHEPCKSFTHNGGGVSMRREPSKKNNNNNVLAGSGTAISSCKRFSAKSRNGPLSSYCRNCNQHKSKCEESKTDTSY